MARCLAIDEVIWRAGKATKRRGDEFPDWLHEELKDLAYADDKLERARGRKRGPGPGAGLKGVIIRACEAYVKHRKGGGHGRPKT